MVKKSLNEFKLNIGESSYDRALPFSLFSALPEGEKNGGEVSAAFKITVGASELYSRNHYVIFRKVKAPLSVYINGEALLNVPTDKDKLHIDLSGRLAEGENLLELRFFVRGKDSLSAGIYGGGEYVRFDNAIIKNVAINQKIEGGIVNLDIAITSIGKTENVRAVATLVSSSGQIYYGGLTKGRGSIVIKDPLYWWPKGLGVQNLYKLTINLYGEREIEDTAEMRIGIKKISTPIKNASSHLEVNGTPFLPMGAVYHPIVESSPASYDKKLNAVITNAAMSGFNAIVVPSGVRAPEELYELCDIHGIVVIREFLGQTEDEYHELVRLSSHPSLGFIDFVTGGEDAIGAADKLQRLRPDLEFSMMSAFPAYPGEPSLPIEKSYSQLIPQAERNLFSETAEELLNGNSVKLLYEISENYLCPSNMSEAAYLSGITASDKIFDKIRSARTESVGSRAIFDSLTDDRELLSGSSVDPFGRRKALHYRLSAAFAPLAVFADRDGLSVGFSVSNERRLAFVGELEFKIIDSKNRVIYKEIADCQVAKSSSKKILTKDLSEYLSGHENEYYLEYYIKEGLGIASKGTMLFTKPKSFLFSDPKIKADISGRERRYSVTLAAESYAKSVELSFSDHDVLLAENYVDLTQNAPYKISFTLLSGEDSTYALARSLKLRSLYDIK